jgi:hypothetical protein
VPGFFEILFVDLDIVGDAADIGFVTVDHHSNSHVLPG